MSRTCRVKVALSLSLFLVLAGDASSHPFQTECLEAREKIRTAYARSQEAPVKAAEALVAAAAADDAFAMTVRLSDEEAVSDSASDHDRAKELLDATRIALRSATRSNPLISREVASAYDLVREAERLYEISREDLDAAVSSTDNALIQTAWASASAARRRAIELADAVAESEQAFREAADAAVAAGYRAGQDCRP